MASLDWSQCPAVESIPGKVSGAWVFRGTRVPVSAIFENLKTSPMGVSRQALNNVISGKSAISVDMAIRLTKAFGSTEETWLRMQLAYDLAEARKEESKIKVRRQHVQELQLR